MAKDHTFLPFLYPSLNQLLLGTAKMQKYVLHLIWVPLCLYVKMNLNMAILLAIEGQPLGAI